MVNRRDFLAGASAVATLAFTSGAPMRALAQGPVGGPDTPTARTLRLIGGSLQSLDPIWTTAPATKDYAFLIFDQLFAVDAEYVPQPQMADGYSVSDDGLTYTITLRDGLVFHDGAPVLPADCIASIKRWSARDGFGRALAAAVSSYEVVDDKSFDIVLSKPFPLLIAALGKSNSSQCFIMPERMANVAPSEQITESIGSGPYRFLAEEWVPGQFSAYARFEGYVPRPEPVSGIAGGRIAAVDRITSTVINDSSTAMSALMAGEQDYWAAPAPDLVPVLETNPDIVIDKRSTSNGYYMLQFNHLQAPFNDPAIRKAVAMAVDQDMFLAAVQSNPALIKPCYSYFDCESAYGTEDGADILKTKSIDAAKAALAASGYAGEKVVILAAMENPVIAGLSQVADDMLRQIGFTTEFVATDFATMTQRRVSKEPVDNGGWSIFITAWAGTDVLNPAVHQLMHGAGEAGWFGWPTDPVLEELKSAWFLSTDAAEQAELVRQIQTAGFESLPYIPLGSLEGRVAYRKELTGMYPAPVSCFWNIGKSSA